MNEDSPVLANEQVAFTKEGDRTLKSISLNNDEYNLELEKVW